MNFLPHNGPKPQRHSVARFLKNFSGALRLHPVRNATTAESAEWSSRPFVRYVLLGRRGWSSSIPLGVVGGGRSIVLDGFIRVDIANV